LTDAVAVRRAQDSLGEKPTINLPADAAIALLAAAPCVGFQCGRHAVAHTQGTPLHPPAQVFERAE
jgi:hypothetical protein